MIKKDIEIVEKKTVWLYDQHDVDKEKEKLIKRIDALIDYLSDQKDEIKSWTIEEMTSESKLDKFKDYLEEEDNDGYEPFFGLFPDMMRALDHLRTTAWNMHYQEKYGDEIDKHYLSFTNNY